MDTNERVILRASARRQEMSEISPRFWPLFLELFESLPRQGPGNAASAAAALALCRGLPPSPVVADLGCGVGGQTLHLAGLTSGFIAAVDKHVPGLVRLRAEAAARGLAHRVGCVAGDMASPGLRPAVFDLVWSEGALYNIGIGNALRVCRELLRPGGYLVFTDAVWRKADPPPEVKASFDFDYPVMGGVSDVVAAIARSGLALITHFTLPDEAWWDDFYTPMVSRIEELQLRYAADEEALAILAQLAQEPEMHRRYSDYYAYEFFVARKTA
jgi:SAM-dependent methyltransferase